MRAGHEAEGRLRAITEYDCWNLLTGSQIARVAWPGTEGVAIVPVNYTVADGSIWFRTDPDSALGQECAGRRIAVEVDEVDAASRAGWSVVVVGTAEVVDAD